MHMECGSFKDCLGLINPFHTGMGTVGAVWHAVPKHCVLIQGLKAAVNWFLRQIVLSRDEEVYSSSFGGAFVPESYR